LDVRISENSTDILNLESTLSDYSDLKDSIKANSTDILNLESTLSDYSDLKDSIKANKNKIGNLEDALESRNIDPLLKKEVEKLLTQLEQLNYQRNATKIQSRKERQEAKKKAEQEEARRLEEEQKRKEEEFKKAKEELERESPTPTVEQFEEAPKEDMVLEGEKEIETYDSSTQKEIQEQPKEVIVTPSKKKIDDRSVFRNESIEFFITQTGRTNTPYYHFAFDTAGNIVDAQEKTTSWNSSCKAWGGKVSNDFSIIQVFFWIDQHVNQCCFPSSITSDERTMRSIF
jgi:hypothetical protein